ncbi:hypothetical protein ACQR3W_22045 [Rhodococcus ruber]|uniref:Uncharacterized protein n=1 Tax=Rhodococcus ruber TaxID=1830 RepID=A0A098BK25_9NOCA|nr:hypothetical protein [Rhodococcus ruber]MCZ4505931.1 hypothetical protein [Rhodococcus ruber]MCZ4533474.1 hypothetical protein [Rhodococcus ruber]CDZ89053.1 conserved hypothetical protein [Rhodococcus ruber]
MDYDATGNDLDAYLHDSDELRAYVQEVCEVGADIWSVRSVWRTGFNATHIRAYTDRDRDGDMIGVIDAWGHYARYREHGTRYNQAESILADFKDVVEGL